MWDETPKSVLVIQTAFIGDVALAIPLLEAVKLLWAESELDIVVRPPSQNLLETLPYLRHIWIYDKRGRDGGAGGFLRLVAQLRRKRYDLAILPHRSLRSGLLARCAGIPLRVGFNRGGGRLLHSHRIPYPAAVHEIARNLQLLSPFGPIPQVDPPIVIPSEEDVALADQKLREIHQPLLALAPGSVWFSKRWPEVYFAKLGRMLAAEGNFIVLIGGEEDRPLGHRIRAAIGSGCINLCGELSLRQSVEVLRRCRLLVTNDSAPTHLGVASGIYVLTLFGSTIPEFGFAPYGTKGRPVAIELYCRPCTNHGRQKCPEKHFRCMRELTPDRVYDEIKKAVTT